MISITPTKFRKEMFGMLEMVVKENEQLEINTKDGDAVMISKQEYDNILETIKIYQSPKLYSELKQGLKLGIQDAVAEEKVEW